MLSARTRASIRMSIFFMGIPPSFSNEQALARKKAAHRAALSNTRCELYSDPEVNEPYRSFLRVQVSRLGFILGAAFPPCGSGILAPRQLHGYWDSPEISSGSHRLSRRFRANTQAVQLFLHYRPAGGGKSMMPVKGGGCAVVRAIKKTADHSAVFRSWEARIIPRPLLLRQDTPGTGQTPSGRHHRHRRRRRHLRRLVPRSS